MLVRFDFFLSSDGNGLESWSIPYCPSSTHAKRVSRFLMNGSKLEHPLLSFIITIYTLTLDLLSSMPRLHADYVTSVHVQSSKSCLFMSNHHSRPEMKPFLEEQKRHGWYPLCFLLYCRPKKATGHLFPFFLQGLKVPVAFLSIQIFRLNYQGFWLFFLAITHTLPFPLLHLPRPTTTKQARRKNEEAVAH